MLVQLLTSIINTNTSQDTEINNINNTITSFLQTTYFNNYTNNVNSTFTSIINTNTSQDTEINNIKITIPSFLQTTVFNNYTNDVSSTFTSIINTNNTQDVNITNINNTITSFLQTTVFNNYSNDVSSTFTSIINTNTSQDTEINNIKITIPSYLQSATAVSTYQPIGDYVLNNTLNNYTSNISLTLNSIINKNDTQDTSINNILITLPSYLQSATAASTYQPIGDYALNNTLNNYTSNISLTLNSIINKNDTQDTSINNILINYQLSYKSATAVSTYQPIGDYVVNNTLNNYTSNISLTLNSIINKNDTQDTSINNIINYITESYLQCATAVSTYQPIGSYLTTSSANLIYQDLPWVAGQVQVHPITGATILIQAGKNNFTASRSSTGITAIGFPNIGGNNLYAFYTNTKHSRVYNLCWHDLCSIQYLYIQFVSSFC
jgi:hypothetical protein